jgi:hypothetical protein
MASAPVHRVCSRIFTYTSLVIDRPAWPGSSRRPPAGHRPRPSTWLHCGAGHRTAWFPARRVSSGGGTWSSSSGGRSALRSSIHRGWGLGTRPVYRLVGRARGAPLTDSEGESGRCRSSAAGLRCPSGCQRWDRQAVKIRLSTGALGGEDRRCNAGTRTFASALGGIRTSNLLIRSSA